MAAQLIQALRRVDLAMPPDSALPAPQVAGFVRWVESGAVWPEATLLAPDSAADAAARHWAFQPVQRPEIPIPQDAARVRYFRGIIKVAFGAGKTGVRYMWPMAACLTASVGHHRVKRG